MQHVEAAHAHHPCDRIAERIVLGVSDVQVARRIGQHLEYVGLRPPIGARTIRRVQLPSLAPFWFYVAKIVRFGHRTTSYTQATRAVYLSGRRTARDGTACCKNWVWARSRSSSSPHCYGIRRLARHGPPRRRRRSHRRDLPSRVERPRPRLWWYTWPERSRGQGCTHCATVRGRPTRWLVPEVCVPMPIRPASIWRSEFPTAMRLTWPSWENVRPEAARERQARGSGGRGRLTRDPDGRVAMTMRRPRMTYRRNRRLTSIRGMRLHYRPFRESGVRSPVESSNYANEPVRSQRWTSCSTSRA